MPKLKRPPGRPPEQTFSVAELAALLELPERLVRARLALSFFSGAEQVEGEWVVPESAVAAALRLRVEPHRSIASWAALLDVSYSALHRATVAVASLSDPLPKGKRVRARLLCLGEGKPALRVPESEIIRWMGGAL